MSVILKYVLWSWLVCTEPRFLKLIPDDLKTQEMCNKAIEKDPNMLKYVSVCFRTFGMCSRAVEKYLHPLRFIPDHLKVQEMCEKAVEKNPYQLDDFLIVLKPKGCVKKLLKMNQKR